MPFLIRLGLGAVTGALSMLFILGMLENEVNPRRMLFIGALCGVTTATTLEWQRKQRDPLTPIAALTLQLSRMDLSPSDAVAIAEQLATLHAQSDLAVTDVSPTQHPTPNRHTSPFSGVLQSATVQPRTSPFHPSFHQRINPGGDVA